MRAFAACNYADVLRINGDFGDRVRTMINDALAELRRGGGSPDRIVNCLIVSTWLYGVAGRYNESVSAATQAVEIAKQLPSRQKNVLASSHQALGDAHAAGRRFTLAHASYQTSIELSDAIGGGEAAARGRTVGQAAMNLAFAGVPIRALPYFERNAAESRASGRPISRYVVPQYGEALVWVGRAAEGVALHRQALASDRARETPRSINHLSMVAAWSQLAAGDLLGAQALLGDVDSRSADLHESQRSRWTILHGELALAQGNAPAAIERLRAGAAMLEPARDMNAQARRALALAALSYAQRATGDLAGGTATARDAVALASSLQPHRFEVSLHQGLAELALGEALLESGALSEAHAALERAVVQLAGSLGPDAPQLKNAQAALQRALR